MIIRCPNCSTTYKVDATVLDAPNPSFRCSRCKHVFTVQVHLQRREEETDTDPGAPEGESAAETVGTDAVTGAGDDAGGEADARVQRDASDDDTGEALPAEPRVATGADDLPAAGDVAREAVAAPDVDATTVDATTESEPAGSVDPDRDDDEPLDAELPYPEFDPNTAETEGLDEPRSLSFELGDDPADEKAERDRRRPDFDIDIDDDFLTPPERETPPPLPPLDDAKGSVVPLLSLIALTLFAVGLVTLIYMVNPQPLDGLIRQIPWYGPAVFESRHYKRTLVFESLASGVRPVLNQTEVFVVSGKLVNRNDQGMRHIQIEALLFDAEGKQVGRQVTYVGNAISARIIKDMSLREISLLQSLKPQNAYHIPPDGSADFTIVFPKPKAAVASFSCRVLAADADP